MDTKLLASKLADCIALRRENALLRQAQAQGAQQRDTLLRGWNDAACERDRVAQQVEAAHREREQEQAEALEKMLGVQRLLEVSQAHVARGLARESALVKGANERVQELMLSLDKLRRENARLAEDNAKLKHELRQAERSAVETLPVLLPVPMGEMGPQNGADGG